MDAVSIPSARPDRGDAVTSTPSLRFERYVLWSLYVVAPMAPLVAGAVVAQARSWTWATLPFLATVTLAAVLYCPVVTASIRRPIDGGPLSRWSLPFVATGVASAALGAVGLLADGDVGLDGPAGGFLIGAVLTASAFAPLLTWPQLVGAAGGLGAATSAVWVLTGAPSGRSVANGRWFPTFFSAGLISLGLLFSVWMSLWMLRQMREQAELTRVRAELAVAEERLRFSRDLHDIFGRTLTAVAVKSDLAAELAAHDRAEEAAAEMRDVHRLAEEAAKEVRAVVGGYRAVNLDAELKGARAMLGAAGIDARIIGDGHGLTPGVAEGLAWAVREGVTNVVRHSSAGRCTIRVTATDGDAVVQITNDGAPPQPGENPGSGLRGLRDRLAPLGGAVATERAGSSFTLTATLPLERP